MKPEDLIAALGRGIAEAALAHAEAAKPTVKVRRKKTITEGRTIKVSTPETITGQMEMPFEPETPVAPVITAEQLAEMEAVLQGKRGPLPGTYYPDGEYRPESIPWMS